jgi:hypothetical protein
MICWRCKSPGIKSLSLCAKCIPLQQQASRGEICFECFGPIYKDGRCRKCWYADRRTTMDRKRAREKRGREIRQKRQDRSQGWAVNAVIRQEWDDGEFRGPYFFRVSRDTEKTLWLRTDAMDKPTDVVPVWCTSWHFRDMWKETVVILFYDNRYYLYAYSNGFDTEKALAARQSLMFDKTTLVELTDWAELVTAS